MNKLMYLSRKTLLLLCAIGLHSISVCAQQSYNPTRAELSELIKYKINYNSRKLKNEHVGLDQFITNKDIISIIHHKPEVSNLCGIDITHFSFLDSAILIDGNKGKLADSIKYLYDEIKYDEDYYLDSNFQSAPDQKIVVFEHIYKHVRLLFISKENQIYLIID